jgi:hypothetical protein
MREPVGLATNAEPANVDFILDRGGLRAYFRVVVDGHQVQHAKPHPEIYLRAAQLLSAAPRNCIVFEDSFSGVEAARAAGARIVGLRTTHRELPGADLADRRFPRPATRSLAAGAGPGRVMRGPLLLMTMPVALPFGVFAIAAIVFAIWRRDERLRGQREMLRRAYELGEEILGASSADQILDKVKVVVPKIFGVTSAQLYLYNRHAKTLEAVDRGADQASIPLSAPPAGPQAGAVACFHYRTLLAIPDTSRSPFPVTGSPARRAPRMRRGRCCSFPCWRKARYWASCRWTSATAPGFSAAMSKP